MNCLIIEDEPLAREGLRLLVKDNTALNLCGCFSNADAALEFLKLNHVDLLFLDIELPGMSGLALARSLPEHTMVIFTTAYSEYALDSYDVKTIDYLVKPIRPERFMVAVSKALAHSELVRRGNIVLEDSLKKQNDYLFVRADRKYYKVFYEDLRYVEALKDYVILHLADKSIIANVNLKKIYEQLPFHIFVRISKSCIVNIHYVESVEQYTIKVAGKEHTLGDVYKEHFFNSFIKGTLINK